MATSIDALRIRRKLGRDEWGVPTPFGPDGWYLDNLRDRGRIIVTVSERGDIHGEDRDFIHASISWADRNPTYDDLKTLHQAVWGDSGFAYQVFAPAAEHVNIHAHALHLWGLLSGDPLLPNFAIFGSI